MVGKKIRAYREFRGYSQIQLAELSGINVGTIRKYELGIRNPKPDQLEKIATALGLNVSVFLDFNIETVGDVLSILFAIDDSVNLSLSETSDQKIAMTFDNPTMQDFFKKWCQFKNVYEKEKAEILAIKDENKRQEELDKIGYDQVDLASSKALNQTVSRKSLVLLKNEDNFLPLDKSKLHTIGVIGPNADSRKALVGNYEGTASRYITVLEGIEDYVGDDVNVFYS